jgi:hypothetical protein
MHVEENYPKFHKSQIKGKQWFKQWLVKMGSKHSNKWNKDWKKIQESWNSRKKKDEIKLKRKNGHS